MSTTLTIFAGTANPDLASRTVQNLGIHLGECRIESFPDGELQVELKESVRGHDVYLLQSTSPPADKTSARAGPARRCLPSRRRRAGHRARPLLRVRQTGPMHEPRAGPRSQSPDRPAPGMSY